MRDPRTNPTVIAFTKIRTAEILARIDAISDSEARAYLKKIAAQITATAARCGHMDWPSDADLATVVEQECAPYIPPGCFIDSR